ncbi:MAG: IPTL-CTERM sorting domain-containing protein [Acidobacteriota bacterium]
MLALGLMIAPPSLSAQPLADPSISAQVEHPANTPIADIFGGSYVDSTDDPRTGVSAHDSGQVDMTIGEEFNIILTVSLPERTIDDTFFISQASPRTQILSFDGTVLEILSADVIHIGSNLSGTGVPPLGALTIRDLNPIDGDGTQFQYGSATTDITVAADGVTDDLDRVVLRVRARLDDEDASGGPADALPGVDNVDGGVASNRIQLAWSDGQRNSFSTVDIVEPAVSLTKSTQIGAGLMVGDIAQFELLISNTGTAPAYNLVVADSLPTSGPDVFLAFDSLDATESTCDDVPGFQLDASIPPAIFFSFDLLDAGSSCTVVFRAELQASAALNETYTNTATVTSFDSRDDATDTDNRRYAGGSDTSDITTGGVDLQLTKSDGGVSLLPGEPLVYTLDYLNSGSRDAAGVILTETVPAHTTFDASGSTAGWSCPDGSSAGTTCSLPVGSVAAGGGSGQALFAIQVDAPLSVQVTSIDNFATIDDDGTGGADLVPGDNSARASTPVINTAGLTLVKSASPRDGTDFTFTSTIPGDTVVGQGSFDVALAGAAAGLAVDSTGDLYVLSEDGIVAGLSSDGSPNGLSFDTGLGSGQAGLALDGEGIFYVVDTGGDVIQLDIVGIPTGFTFAVPAGTGLRGIAADASGNVFVLYQNGDIAQFDRRGLPTGLSFNAGLPDSGAGLTVDGIGHLWAVSVDGTVVELDSQGAPTGFQFNAGLGAAETAIGVAEGGDIYVADASGRVGIFRRGGIGFTLDDEPVQTDSVDTSITFDGLPVGSYDVTEMLPPSWELTGVVCSGGADPGNVVGSTLSVAIAAGETVSCTWNNNQPRVDMQIGQSESIDPVVAGSGIGNLSYVVTVTNAGPSDATGLEISELLTLPAGVSVASITPSGGTFSAPTWTVGDLPSGSSATLTVVLTVDATAAVGTDTITSAAAVTAVDQVETNPGNDSASESTSIIFSLIADFGDAPDPGYPTLLASNGARHGQPSSVFLGAAVDSEPDGQPTDSAIGDDIDGSPDDEDGFAVAVPLAPGTSPLVDVTASAPGILSAWIDFDQDGAWSAGEQVLADVAVNAGVNSLAITVPADATLGPTVARLRIASVGGLSVTGAAADGEVEDHRVEIQLTLDDTDGDGVPDDVEDAAPESGDGNADGLRDSLQPSVTSLPSAASGTYLTLETTDAGCGFTAVEVIDPAMLPGDGGGAFAFTPVQGFVGFEVGCAGATVSVIYHFESPLVSPAYRQFGPTPSLPEDHWYSLDAMFTTRDVEGFLSATAVFELTDGELGDHDLAADGRIVALGGLVSEGTSPTVIPTLSTWGLLALSLMLAAYGGAVIRRRRA